MHLSKGKLEDEVYIEQPPSFVNSKYLTYVCKHHKAIYGLRQAPSACYKKFKNLFALLGLLVLSRIPHFLQCMV